MKEEDDEEDEEETEVMEGAIGIPLWIILYPCHSSRTYHAREKISPG
jgi:hypothetical protein